MKIWMVEASFYFVENLGKTKCYLLHIEDRKYDMLMIYVPKLQLFFGNVYELYKIVDCRWENFLYSIETEFGTFRPLKCIRQMFSKYSINRKNGQMKQFKIFLKTEIFPHQSNFERYIDNTRNDIYQIRF